MPVIVYIKQRTKVTPKKKAPPFTGRGDVENIAATRLSPDGSRPHRTEARAKASEHAQADRPPLGMSIPILPSIRVEGKTKAGGANFPAFRHLAQQPIEEAVTSKTTLPSQVFHLFPIRPPPLPPAHRTLYTPPPLPIFLPAPACRRNALSMLVSPLNRGTYCWGAPHRPAVARPIAL